MNTEQSAQKSVILASKSIPRSGHHLLKRLLKAGFNDQFTHCEWYYEPGCCHRIPCKLSEAFCNRGQTIRLIKSHDFELKDPVLNEVGIITVVGYRHPLWSLTSDFVYALRQQEAQRLGISHKMEYLHEPAVVDLLTVGAHKHLSAWSSSYLNLWLAKRVSYQIQFLRKWNPEQTDELTYSAETRVINCPYERLINPHNAQALLTWVASATGAAVPDVRPETLQFIKPSRSPWHVSNDMVAGYLDDNREIFSNAACMIVQETGLGYEKRTDYLTADAPSDGSDQPKQRSSSPYELTGPVTLKHEVISELIRENGSLLRRCAILEEEAGNTRSEINRFRKSLIGRILSRTQRLLRSFSAKQ